MSHVDDIESDFSVFHRVDDFWCRPSDWIMRMTSRLVAYNGALAVAMTNEKQHAVEPPYIPPLPTARDDFSTDDVERLWSQHLIANYRERGFDVTGIEEISPDEMRSMLDG